ncbi:MAG TPA: site-specific integrase [Microlunatus sp.]
MSDQGGGHRRRRRPGEGGVSWSEQRQRWIAEKTVGYDGRGKRIVRKASGRSEAAALRALDKRVRDYRFGLVRGSEHYRVGQAVEDWLDHGQGDADPVTVTRYRSLCARHVVPNLGGRKVRELRPEEVDEWLAGLAVELASSTLRLVKWCLSSSITRAMKRGYVERNVVDLCRTPRGRAGRRSKSLTLKQAEAVLTYTRGDRMHCYIAVSLLTGARTEEMRALRWEHVHLDEDPPLVEVWRSVRAGGDTKTRTSRRTLALPALAVLVLKEHKARQAEARLKATSWADPGLVFATSAGTVMNANNVIRDFRLALKKVPGVDPDEWTPREMRHSFVSLLSDSGLTLEAIADLVGHKDTKTTELVYRHHLRPVIQTGATMMDTLFPLPESKGGEGA